MSQMRQNIERKGQVGELRLLAYEVSKMSSGSPKQSGMGRDEDFTLKGVAALVGIGVRVYQATLI